MNDRQRPNQRSDMLRNAREAIKPHSEQIPNDPPRFAPIDGYRKIAYRPPLAGELHRLEDCDHAGQVATTAADMTEARWIVERINPWTIDESRDDHGAALTELEAWRRDNWPALPPAVAIRAAVQQFIASDDECQRDSIVSALQDAA